MVRMPTTVSKLTVVEKAAMDHNLVGGENVTMEKLFGKTNEGADVTMYTLKNAGGMEVEIINASLTVRVRGAAGQISQLTGDDIKAVVDFSNAVAGTATYKASITFGEEFTAVGAVMGPYSVSATVKG